MTKRQYIAGYIGGFAICMLVMKWLVLTYGLTPINHPLFLIASLVLIAIGSSVGHWGKNRRP